MAEVEKIRISKGDGPPAVKARPVGAFSSIAAFLVPRAVSLRVRQRTAGIVSEPWRAVMKRILALALATFLGLGLLSTGLSVAQDAIGGVTSGSGSYGIN